MNVVLSMVILALIKVIDNLIMTAKSIATYQNKKLISSILVIISQFLFYLVIQQVISDNSSLSILVVSISSGVGTYIAFLINDKFKKDVLYINSLTCSDRNDITNLCNYLVDNKIKYIVNDSYTRKWKETYSVMIFAKSKYESKVIDKFLDNTDVKYLREIIQ